MSDPDLSRLDRVKALLALPASRRATGSLDGRHRSLFRGRGHDLDDLRHYAPGDDVGDIDWASSARAGLPIVRRFVHESTTDLVLVVDTGRSMAATTPRGEAKSDVAGLSCALLAYLAREHDDRVALVAGDRGRLTHLPPRASTPDIEALLRTAERLWDHSAPPSDLTRPVLHTARTVRRPALVVVITDEARPTAAHAYALHALGARHEVLVVRVADRSATAAPASAVDVDTGFRLPPYLRGRATLTAAADAAVARRHAEADHLLRMNRLHGALITGTDDVVPRLAELLGRHRAG